VPPLLILLIVPVYLKKRDKLVIHAMDLFW